MSIRSPISRQATSYGSAGTSRQGSARGGNSVDTVAASNAYRATFPGRDIRAMRLLGEGWDSVVYLADDAFVLRFPKTSSAARAMSTEIRLLPYLRDRLPLSIPQPIVVGIHPFERSWPFMGYACIPGVELTRERFWALPSHARTATMRSLTAFLEALHTVVIDAAKECGVTVRDLREEFADVFTRAEALVAPALERRERATFVAWFQGVLNDAKNFRASPTLIHGDLSPGHIFHDPVTHGISGIIDFGDVAIADPDYDLMYLLEDYGGPFLRELLRYYRHADSKRLLGKLQAFRLFDAARYTLFGHARGDAEMIRDGLVVLRELLSDANA
jgi:aminoglycoside 2''-phosphotransferase